MRAAVQVGQIKQAGVSPGFAGNPKTASVIAQSGRIAHATAHRYLAGEDPPLRKNSDVAHRSADRAFSAGVSVLDEIRPRVLYLERAFKAVVGGLTRVAKPDIVAEAADGSGLEIIEIKTHRSLGAWPSSDDRATSQLAFFTEVVAASLDRPVTVLSVISLAYAQYRSVPARHERVSAARSGLRAKEQCFARAAATSTWPTKPSPDACGNCPIASTCADAFTAPTEGEDHGSATQIQGAA